MYIPSIIILLSFRQFVSFFENDYIYVLFTKDVCLAISLAFLFLMTKGNEKIIIQDEKVHIFVIHLIKKGRKIK